MAGDVREHPRYSVEDAAYYLRIPVSTMRAWVSGYKTRSRSTGMITKHPPVIIPADSKRLLLSFYNLAEAHVLRSTRDKNVPLSNVRRAIEFVRDGMKQNHPLISNDFATSGRDIFVEHLGQPVNATRYGQVGMREVIQQYLERIERDEYGMPRQFSPMYAKHIAINPMLSSGKPVLRGTGIMVEVLSARKESGESYSELADDFGLSQTDIEQVIKEFAA